MDDTKIPIRYTCEQFPVSSEQMFPATPFPRNFVHGVVNDLRYAVQAVQALRAAGYASRDIHVMASWDYVEAIQRRDQQRSALSKMYSRFSSFLDEGFGNVYLHEALQGRHVLAVHLCRKEQREQVRHLLAIHHVFSMKYVDRWTVTDLPLSQDEHSAVFPLLR
jgi:hypothetical protein